jgi:NADH dehydrogenase FAD-containing subunit
VISCNSLVDIKPRVVIVGCGWAGFRIAQDLDKNKFDVHLVSPRNHFLFTPLLPSTAVGTLEFRAIQEPVRTIPHMHYSQAWVKSIDFDASSLSCVDAFTDHAFSFELPYDVLLLAPGGETNTFNVKGVNGNPNVFFLKQLQDSRKIRNKLIDCFERASSPALVDDLEHRKKLLNFVVVGGGPTSVEFAAELYDFLKEDVSRWYPDLYKLTRVQIVEASGHLLGSFNAGLVSYVEHLFKSRNIELLTDRQVKEVTEDEVVLGNGERIPFGLVVWSTGIKQVPLIDQLSADSVSKYPLHGRLRVDKYLRVLKPVVSAGAPVECVGNGRVFALGDCAADSERPLPALAQVALQQGKYVAKLLNTVTDVKLVEQTKQPGFKYQHLGSMASVGQWKGVFDVPRGEY